MSNKRDKLIACCGSLLAEIIRHAILHRSYAAPFSHNLTGYGLEQFCQNEFWIKTLQFKRRVMDDIHDDPSGCFGTIDLRPVFNAIANGMPARDEDADAQFPRALLLHLISSSFTNCDFLADVCLLKRDELMSVVQYCRMNPSRLGSLATLILPEHIRLSPDIAMIIGETSEQLNEEIRTQQLLSMLKIHRKKIGIITGSPISAIQWMGTQNTPGRPTSKIDPRLEGLVIHTLNLFQPSFDVMDPLDLYTQIVRFIVEFYQGDEREEISLKHAGQHLGVLMGRISKWNQADVRRCTNACSGMGLNITITPSIKKMATQVYHAVDIII